MVWLRWVTRSWSDSLILDSKTILYRKIFIWTIAPNRFTNFLMELFGKCLSQTICKSLYHHITIIIARFYKLFTEFILFETCRDGKKANIISFTWRFWCNKVTHSNKSVLIFINLLSQSTKCSFHFTQIIFIINLNILISSSRITRIKSNNSSCFYKPFFDNLFQHFLSTIKKLFSLFSYSFIIKYFWISSVWILASDLPCWKEWIPVNKRNQFSEIIFFVNLCP